MDDTIPDRGNIEDRRSLALLLADRLEQDQRLVCFLLGSGLVVPTVPGVGTIVERAKAWIAVSGDDVAEPSTDPQAAAPRPVGPEDYGIWLSNILQRFHVDGQRAFVQRLALDAYTGAQGEEIRERLDTTHTPLSEEQFGVLAEATGDWNIPPGLAAMAEIVADHPEIARWILTTNFDPLIAIALQRAGLKVRQVSAATDTDLRADRTGKDAITVLHLHGDCYGGITLHTADELKRRRPTVWRELIDYLRGKHLFVVGYSGWDDIVRECLAVVLSPGGDLTVAWSVFEPDEEALRQSHPHLVRLLQDAEPQAIPYYGVDRDVLFDSVCARKSPARKDPPARKNGTTVQLLHQEFRFGQDGLDGSQPEVLFWPHRLRRPHLLHGVHAITAAALAREGVTVELHLDDIGVPPDQAEQLVEEFKGAVRSWFAAAGASSEPTILRYSEQLDLEEPDTRSALWGIAERINQTPTTLRELLSATKVIDPRAFDAPPRVFAEYIVANLDDADDGRLLRPVLNYAILERAMERHGLDETGGPRIATLGGGDERPLWLLWEQVFRRRTGHLFVPRLAWSPKWRLWSMRPLLYATDYGEGDLESFLVSAVQHHDGAELFLQWVWNCGIRLWSWIDDAEPNPTMTIGEREIVTSADVVAAMSETPAQAARALAEGVGAWFYAGA